MKNTYEKIRYYDMKNTYEKIRHYGKIVEVCTYKKSTNKQIGFEILFVDEYLEVDYVGFRS